MNRTISDKVTVKGNFTIARVALYLFAAMQTLLALLTATGVISLGIAPEAPTMQRIWIVSTAVVNILCFSIGYVLLARCLNCCTTLVWRVALSIFLLNLGLAALSIAVQPNPSAVLTYGLSVAGAISLLRGHTAIRNHATSRSSD